MKSDNEVSIKSQDLTLVEDVRNDWPRKSLYELIDLTRKITYGIVQPGVYSPNGKYMIRGQDYSNGWQLPETLFKVDQRVEEPYRRARVKENDLLMTIVGYIGTLALVPKWLEGANLTQTTARLAFKPTCSPYFYYYFFQSSFGLKILKKYEKGLAQPGLNLTDIEKFVVPVPPLEEQQKIAKILQTIDTTIEKTKELIDKNKKIKQGLMKDLLNYGLGGKRKNIQIGNLWKKLKRGPSLSTNLQGSGLIYLTSENLTEDNHLDWSEIKHLDNYYKKDSIIELGDVIINCVNSEDRIGKTAFYNLKTSNVIVGFNNFAIKFNEVIDSKYMYYHLSEYNTQIEIKKTTKPAVNQVSFSGSDLFKINVNIPIDINEQKKITKILDSADAKIISHKKTLSKLLKIKDGLLQDILTGKVSVAS